MWQSTVFFLIVHSALGVQNRQSRLDPLVSTKLGLIRGTRSENGRYSQFLGIPYGLVDEEQPFSPSIPHPQFEEAFNAYDDSVICPQMSMVGGVVSGQIQCLVLNIYVPNSASSQNQLPVMVHIHGGAFSIGSGNNEMGTPSYLVDKDVIVVSINYRLGIYGFMCTDSPKAPGNIGLKDQLLALRWINEHIESFGGDSNKVTIFGESAGGMSVHLHLLSHHEKLFDRAIIESGPATSPWSFVDLDNSLPIKIAETLGLVTEDVDEAIEFIARADVELAIAAGSLHTSTSQYSNEPLTKACVENEFEGIERFVTENPNVVKPEKAKSIQVIIGYASQELIFQHARQTQEFYEQYSFKDLLQFGFDVIDDDMADVVRHFYIGDQEPSERLNNEITSFASDFVFNHPAERAVDLLLKSDAIAVYHYVFSYVGERSSVSMINTTLIGASHCDESNYLFETQMAPSITAEDQLMIDRMTTMWTNFAKYGDPTPATSELLPVKWEPVSQDYTSYLNIDKALTMESRPFHDRMAFWDLFYKLNEGKTKWYDAV